MGEDRLTGMALLMIYRDIDIDYNVIINTNARKQPRRMGMVNIMDY